MCLFLKKKKICEIKFEKQRERKTFFLRKILRNFAPNMIAKIGFGQLIF